ncbi:hypothetical protein MOV08_24905 [Streptomyces yunnanensis]|uniref:Uncharacterized protein n=1 Tax=Streptomyces yunnanensis TaxID=156453 RepID=A0ABY8AB05_9ACTN|nr:hypothetical protein [Streptomyces yunnanensis]WEB42172.1 hypothetical protein MOV08_24905 [Streptomyces yunnanensis]
MRIRRFLATGVAAAAMVAFGSTPAFAEDAMAHTTDGSTWGGKANWRSYGDRLEACDNAADGMTVQTQIQTKGYGSKLLWTRGGRGSCNHLTWDLPEWSYIQIRVCLLDGNLKPHNCSRWVAGSA